MRAALLDTLGAPLRVADVDDPSAGPGEIVLDVEACGVCHSDLHLAAGEWPDCAARTAFPAILGHEVIGRVSDGPQQGQRVGVGWLHSVCGACEHCADGAENVCLRRTVTSVDAPGGYATRIRVRADQVVAVPDGLDAAEAAPLFCAGLTVFHACRIAEVRAGQRVAVFGAGGLGHLAIQIARHAGADVVAVDPSPSRRALAEAVGAEAVDPADAADRLRGPHVALVTAPSRAAYDVAIRTLRRRGTLAVVGLPKDDLTFFADDLAVGEFRIVGSAVGTRAEMRELLALAASGALRVHVERFPLEQAADVLGRVKAGTVNGRAVLTMR